MKENESFILSGNELELVSTGQKIQQWFYGVSEPYILKFADYMLADEKRKEILQPQGKETRQGTPLYAFSHTETADEEDEFMHLDYYKLSEIRMEYRPVDMEEFYGGQEPD